MVLLVVREAEREERGCVFDTTLLQSERQLLTWLVVSANDLLVFLLVIVVMVCSRMAYLAVIEVVQQLL